MNASLEHVAARIRQHDLRYGEDLLGVLTGKTGLSSAGFPFLSEASFARFRDRVPHILGCGQQVLAESEQILEWLQATLSDESVLENAQQAHRVIRQVIYTASITATPDLWLLKHVVGALSEVGVVDALLLGEAIEPTAEWVVCGPEQASLDGSALRCDLSFLLARGTIDEVAGWYTAPSHSRARRILQEVGSPQWSMKDSPTQVWQRCFSHDALSSDERDALRGLCEQAPRQRADGFAGWFPTAEDIELAWVFLPILLGLHGSGRSKLWLEGSAITPQALVPEDPGLSQAVCGVCEKAGILMASGEKQWALTEVGRRVLQRGPATFAIVQTYQAYVDQLVDILEKGRASVWVERGGNVAASQAANRQTFVEANDAIDLFCEQTGFSFQVFIEHALGKGEATRQRYERSGGKKLVYFGADLEDAAIEAARQEKKAGKLPRSLTFIPGADIGRPECVTAALKDAGASSRGAVMVVGNGFHEVRGQTDEEMVKVFRGYCDAGIVLVFTEESALSVDDLLQTAWNTYHAGFKYLHEKSGQGLRPAFARAPQQHGPALPMSWNECATRAGYVRVHDVCKRSRTIYPYPPERGVNPAIRVNHFFVPGDIAKELGLS